MFTGPDAGCDTVGPLSADDDVEDTVDDVEDTVDDDDMALFVTDSTTLKPVTEATGESVSA